MPAQQQLKNQNLPATREIHPLAHAQESQLLQSLGKCAHTSHRRNRDGTPHQQQSTFIDATNISKVIHRHAEIPQVIHLSTFFALALPTIALQGSVEL